MATRRSRGIVNFLSESSRSFGRINLFDVTRAATGATCKFTDVASTSIWQFLPMLKFPFVLFARRHWRGLSHGFAADTAAATTRDATECVPPTTTRDALSLHSIKSFL